MKLQRHPANPIVKPHPDHSWEDLAVFNPAAWHDAERKEVLLYRAAESHPEYNRWEKKWNTGLRSPKSVENS